MGSWLHDLKFAWRSLRRSPGFATLAVATLALGIGANTAIFSVVKGTLVEPLPYADADRLVMFWSQHPKFGSMSISYPDYLDWSRESSAFSDMAVYRRDRFNLTGLDEPEQVRTTMISANLLRTLRVEPLLGRDFGPDDDRTGGAPVAVLTYGYWQRRFGGDPEVVGRSLTLNGRAYSIVGVAPERLRHPSRSDLFVPIGLFAAEENFERGNHPGIFGMARLAPGATLASAQQEMDGISAALSERYESNRDETVELHSAPEFFVRGIRPALTMLSGAVALVLLIACVNVANLLLGRATEREREMALRASLGAGGWRLTRQVLVESVLLAVAGGAVGTLVASWGVGGLKVLVGSSLPAPDAVRIDGQVLLFTAALSTLAGLLFGLLPALRAGRRNLVERLHGGHRAGQGRESRRAQGALAIVEIALALVLLVGAGLLTRSFARVLAVDPGFEPKDVLTVDISLPADRYGSEEAQRQFWDALLSKVAALPGVTHAGITNDLPLVGGNQTSYAVVGRPRPEPGHSSFTEYAQVSPDYFATLGMRLERGRWLTEEDGPDALRTVVIDRKLAELQWPGADPLGQQIQLGPDADEAYRFTVVGVVSTIHYEGLDVEPPRPQLYISARQYPQLEDTLVVRAAVAPLSLAPAIRRAVAELDPQQPVANVRPYERIVGETLSSRRASMSLIALFAGLAMLLALVGIYGVVSYGVARRTREMGVRMALGAGSRQIFGLVLRETGWLALGGTAGGLLAALSLVHWMRGQLFGLSAYDPATFAGVATLIVVATLAAAAIPARRAVRLEPVEALRVD